MKNYESLVDALSDLRKRGYEAEFETESFCLYCGDLDMRLNPEAFHVDEIDSVRDDSSTDDNTLIYAISSDTGVKGTLVDEHGSSLENMNSEITTKSGDQHSDTASIAK